ncbi:het domain protein [Colletotrichum plurivorum]|uniref:Het domain protein n=1 Tax=Colletotrichum plurivorum TaxID=2175906 RepID=A0A8H6JQ72_9PEZI|nr:het domain protein [Colletotrichum plurivorum]
MYLLSISETERPGQLDVCLELHVGNIPSYAILSHRWGPPSDEVKFQDLVSHNPAAKLKHGYKKLISSCAQALEYGLSYAWIDTCCIDKSSSAELSEAINSIYPWYEASQICFAYMEDVPPGTHVPTDDSAFRKSVWFERGWTLQELIAPSVVIFFDRTWTSRTLGTRSSLSGLISEITGVRKEILEDKNKIHTASVAQKMSWASRRHTTRVEDEAYSLMGIFGISMPTVYGEGRKAFLRLQEEIMKVSTDHTIFAWQADDNDQFHGMLATSPSAFLHSVEVSPLGYNDFIHRFNMVGVNLEPSYAMTNSGLQIQLPVVSMSPYFEGYHFAYLAASWGSQKSSVIIFLRQREDRPPGHFSRIRFNNRTVIHRVVPEGGYASGKYPGDMHMQAARILVSENKSSQPQNRGTGSGARLRFFMMTKPRNNRVDESRFFKIERHVANDFKAAGMAISVKSWKRLKSEAPLVQNGEILWYRVLLGKARHLMGRRAHKDEDDGDVVIMSLAFGLHCGEPWAGAVTHARLPLAAAYSARNDLMDFDMFSGSSMWQRRSDRVTLLHQDLKKSGKNTHYLGEVYFD